MAICFLSAAAVASLSPSSIFIPWPRVKQTDSFYPVHVPAEDLLLAHLFVFDPLCILAQQTGSFDLGVGVGSCPPFPFTLHDGPHLDSG